MKPLQELLRPNILRLSPYSSARDEYAGHEAHVFLDANENPFNTPYNRYPDPLQRSLKAEIAKVKGVGEAQMCLGNGSDETIDLVFRCFCRPQKDNVVAIDPTYGMYKVCADVNDVEYRSVSLDDNFQLSADRLLDSCDDNTKVIWLCSPNNPSGNNLDRKQIEMILELFDGIVVVDEAYADFSQQRPFRLDLIKYPNLIVLNTMSKAWGCAGIRLGMAFANSEIISVFNKVKYPYNVSALTQDYALKEMKNPYEVDKWVKTINLERQQMIEAFKLLPICEKVYPTDANFFLAKMTNAQAIYDYLVKKGIIVRNRTNVHLCSNCLRVTIGTRNENSELMAALRQY